MPAALGVIHSPARAEMDTQLGHTISNGLGITDQSTLQPLDPCGDDGSACIVLDALKPVEELGKRARDIHALIVIERLHRFNL